MDGHRLDILANGVTTAKLLIRLGCQLCININDRQKAATAKQVAFPNKDKL